MRTKTWISKHAIPERTDDPYMYESLLFSLLMVVCVVVLVYGIVEIVNFFKQNINAHPSP